MRVPLDSAPDEPSRSLEIELKFDVDAATGLPALSALPGVVAVAEPEVRELDARYLDTAGLDLAQAGYALRRRTGGPDAGWHIKGPRIDGARLELGWPLGADDGDEPVPEAVLVAVRTVTDAELGPLARIRNLRTAHLLLDVEGGVVAEFVDDHVSATDERTGITREWREWEFELGPAAPADRRARDDLFAAVERVVAAAGGRAAASASKLARALGH